MLVFDRNRFGSKREIDANGYLRVSACNITKAQVRIYYGKEIPGWKDFNLDPDKIYNVYCPAEELKKALETFNNLPLTRDHIEVNVNNVPKDKIVGSLGDSAQFKSPYVQNSIIVYDQKDIDWIMSGRKRELSCGYTYTPVQQSGEFNGLPYDFIMTEIVGNHVALVKEGRAGHDVMVADERPNFTENENNNKLLDKGEESMVNDEFKEADHPRDKDGKFTSAGGSSSSLKDDKDVDNYWQSTGSKESQESGNVKVMKKQLEDLKAEHKKIFGKPMFVSKEEQERGEMIGKQIKELEGEIAKKESEGKEKGDLFQKQLSSLKDSLKSQLSKEITSNPEKLRELAQNDDQLTKLAEVTNMGQGHLKNALNEMADELGGSEKKEEPAKEESNVSPEVKNHLEKKINGWYENVRQDYKGIDGKFLGVSAEGDKLKINWEENGKKKTSVISWYKDYTPEQLYDIWMEFGDEGQEAVDDSKKEMAKDAEIPEKAGKPEKAGEEEALNKGEEKVANEVKEAVAEKKEEVKEELTEDSCGKGKDAEGAKDEGIDKRKLIDEIGGILKGKLEEELWRTVMKKAEELAYNDSERSADDKKPVKDEKEKDLKGKEEKAFAEGVDFGEKKEKEEPKKLDSEHEAEGTKKADEKAEEKAEKKAEEKAEAKAEDKKEAKDKCTMDSQIVMDIDAIKAQVREEVMADFKARETARKAVRSIVGDVNVMTFDSAEDIYKFACEKAGMDLNEIVSFKDAFRGLSAAKGMKLALDASPVSGSNEECLNLKNIRIA